MAGRRGRLQTTKPNVFSNNPFATATSTNAPSSQLRPPSFRFPEFQFSDDQPTIQNPYPSSSSLPSPVAAFMPTAKAITTFIPPFHDSSTVQEQRHSSIARMNQAKAALSPRQSGAIQSTSQKASNRFNTPSTNAIGKAHYRYWISMLPFTLQEEYQHPGIRTPPHKFKTSAQMLALLRALDAFNLIIKVDIPRAHSSSLWQSLDSSIRDHASTQQIVLLPHPSHPDPSDFEHSSWDLIVPRSKTASNNRLFSVEAPLKRDFTHDTLSKFANRTRHPDEEDIRLLFIAPRYGHLQGPLLEETFGPTHICFPLRVFAGTTLLLLEDEVEGCVEGCPDFGSPVPDDFTHFDTFSEPGASIVHQAAFIEHKAPYDESEWRPSKRQKSVLSIDSNDDNVPLATYDDIPKMYIEIDSESSDDEDDNQDSALVADLIKAAGSPPIKRLPASDILQWRTDVCVAIGPENDVLPLEISGPNVASIVTTLVDLISTISLAKPDSPLDNFTPADAAVTLELPVLISGFFHPARKYNIYSDPADREIGSNGNGVE
ncbi:hypothetical protein B0H17DRAFT_1325340 [Mycena rosella]|uniref:Uncharacterized protein n=1 Tax=Mycena rosella TaxID=1033263 RepID=A0AAD7MA34_MYCRO|nr:hypothetical protein B0H17DRAFT_1325340 [Mycena rosella]